MYTRMRLTRLRHSLLPGHGPLARPSDRFQAILLQFVVLLSLAASAGAVLLGIGIHAGEAAKSREQTASRYTATATLLSDGAAPGTTGRGGTPDESGPARATWVARDGQRHVGEVAAAAGTVAGDEVPIWLDVSGSPTVRPVTQTAAVVDATVIATGLWTGVLFLLAAAYYGVVVVLDRFRLARWQRAWAGWQGRSRRDDQSSTGS